MLMLLSINKNIYPIHLPVIWLWLSHVQFMLIWKWHNFCDLKTEMNCVLFLNFFFFIYITLFRFSVQGLGVGKQDSDFLGCFLIWSFVLGFVCLFSYYCCYCYYCYFCYCVGFFKIISIRLHSSVKKQKNIK